MKKSIMMALCMGMLVFAASCGNKKAETKAEPAKVEVEVITDSAFQQPQPLLGLLHDHVF
jgi:ABC-type Zn uptake system ZnuABC Zn-binding protein ZnuA